MLIFSLYISFLPKHYSSKHKHMRNFWQEFTYAIGNVQVSFQHTFITVNVFGWFLHEVNWSSIFKHLNAKVFISKGLNNVLCVLCILVDEAKHFRSSHHKIMRCWSFSLSHKMLPNFHVYQEFQVFLLGILSTPNII